MNNKQTTKKLVECANPKCKKVFDKSRNGLGNQRYCCPKCREEAASLRAAATDSIYKKPNHCKYCGAEFFGGGNFCSQDCRVIYLNIKKSQGREAKHGKKEMSPLAKINEMARAEGLSYGRYLAAHGYGNFSYMK